MTDFAAIANELIRARDLARLAGDDAAERTLGLLDGHMRAALEFLGVRVLEVTDTPVDDRIHDVVSVRPTDDASADATVCATVMPGYALGGRLIRPQQVVVHRYTETGR